MIEEKTINDFLLTLLRKFPDISGIWFIGSRANGRNIKTTSDWDFVVFSEKEVLPLLIKDNKLKETANLLNIDLLVETDGDKFSSPWKRKTINRNDLKWSKLSESEARYWGAKLRERTAEERVYLTDWEKYAIEHGADDSIDVSGWRIAKKLWPTDENSFI